MDALRINSLRKVFSNKVIAVDDVSLTIHEKDFFALLGPNGAGKSTLINIVSSLCSKTSGSVKVAGFDIDHDRIQAKCAIGLVPQEFNFNILETPLEIVTNQGRFYGLKYRTARARAEQLLTKLGLSDKRKELAKSLSGGMKRRLMIARGLVHNPKLLLLDEPTAGVDVEQRREMWKFLKEINHAGTTIVLTTHYLEEAEQLCNNVALINHGKIIMQASMQELLNQKNRTLENIFLDLVQEQKEQACV